MIDIDHFHELFSTLKRNKLRTFLTACGVFWGIFMLVLMLGFGNGLETGVAKNMFGFAPNSVYVWGGRTSLPFQGLPLGRRVVLTNDDTTAIERQIEGVSALAPRLQLGGWRDGNNVSYGAKTGNFGVMGDYPALAAFEAISPRGRFINQLDMIESRKVAVIGDEVRRILFENDENPIGKYLQIRGALFQLVGVYRSDRAGELGDRANNAVHIPFSTFQRVFNAPNRVGSFSISASADASAEAVERAVRLLLAKRHAADPLDSQAIGSFNVGQKFARVETLFRGIRLFIWLVSVATLCAGALGVSNIMLINVNERTKEFGVRKALGATPASIVSLVLEEAALLTALAGYSGLVVGVAVLELASSTLTGKGTPLNAPQIDISNALVAAGILALSGIMAGIAPARRAARIRPVVALRAE